MDEDNKEAMPSLETFDPTEAKLSELIQETAHIVEVNLDDPEQLATVKRGRLNLRSARVALEKTGKAMRDGANAYAKKVIAREKELIAIIEPEEQRLADFEKQAADLAEKRTRLALLPERKARLEQIGVTLKDDVINAMTSLQFEENVNKLVAEKNEAEAKARQEEQEARQAELDAKEKELKEKEDALARETETREREAKAREEEREKIEKEQKEKEEREAKEKAAAEAKELEDKQKRDRAERYKAFRADLGWTEETAGDFYEKVDDATNKVTLFKKVGEFDLSLIN